MSDSRLKEHLQSQDSGLARKSSRPKVHTNPVHPGMSDRTDTSLGAPPRDNNPPDASSPLPTDPTKQHGSKQFPKPAIHDGMRGHAAITVDSGDQLLAGAVLSGSTKLPAAVKED